MNKGSTVTNDHEVTSATPGKAPAFDPDITLPSARTLRASVQNYFDDAQSTPNPITPEPIPLRIAPEHKRVPSNRAAHTRPRRRLRFKPLYAGTAVTVLAFSIGAALHFFRAGDVRPTPVVAPEIGTQAQARGDKGTEPPADAENLAESFFRLGMAYREGDAVASDTLEAARLLTLAAERGHTAAKHELALMYGRGDGVVQNYPHAVELLRQAALQSHAQSQYLLCLSYSLGRGAERDHVAAYAWCKIALQNGVLEANDALSTINAFLDDQRVSAGERMIAIFQEQMRPAQTADIE